MGDLQTVAQGGQRGIIGFLSAEAGVESEGGEGEGRGIKPAETGEQGEKKDAVLSAGYPDRDMVAGLDHLIALNRRARRRKQFLQWVGHGKSPFVQFPLYKEIPFYATLIFQKEK